MGTEHNPPVQSLSLNQQDMCCRALLCGVPGDKAQRLGRPTHAGTLRCGRTAGGTAVVTAKKLTLAPPAVGPYCTVLLYRRYDCREPHGVL
jgi:hypothetical protein